jgi:hypothetical protein
VIQQTLVMEYSKPQMSPIQSHDESDLDDDNKMKLKSSNGLTLCSEEATEILVLPKLPNQDIDIFRNKDKTLSQLLQKIALENTFKVWESFL